MKKGRMRCFFLVLIISGLFLPFRTLTVSASENEEILLEEAAEEYADFSDVEMPDPLERLNGYAEKELQEQIREKNGDRRLRKNNASKLDGLNRQVYSLLYQDICAVAAGERNSTIFTIDVSDLSVENGWTAEDLGVSSLVTNLNGSYVISQEAKDAVDSLLGLNLQLIVSSLLADCPYELYWYDKTANTRWKKYGFLVKDNILSITGTMEFSFPVSSDYAVDTYVVDDSYGDAVQRAKENAADIVRDHEGEGDFERLDTYRIEICNLVSYNNSAFPDDADYGNPWQIIWVFDDDPDTNVVCEGYSKAFQYLCDLSTFKNSIAVRTVTGTLNDGNHMWNVVKMEDDRNYLVDITNCDTNTVGEPDYLFLMGTALGSVDTAYTFTTPHVHRMIYKYSDVARSVYSTAELTLAERSYSGKYDGDEDACAEGHDYHLDGWLWSDDRSSASAVFVCSRNEQHTCTVAATLTEEMDILRGGTVCTATLREEDSPDHTQYQTSIVIPYFGWYTSPDNKQYYFDRDGVLSRGWVNISGSWYYFDGQGVMQTGWRKIGSTWYYLEENGAMATGWKNLSGRWYYLEESGAMATGWKNLSGRWYYLEGSGAMATGWKEISGKWYYLEESGAMATGWKYLSGRWYYLESSGAMATGWKNLSGKWYYLESSGAMATGWKEISGKWYYLEESGAMATEWKYLSGRWYYFGSDGAMRTGRQKIRDKWYVFDSNGRLIQ